MNNQELRKQLCAILGRAADRGFIPAYQHDDILNALDKLIKKAETSKTLSEQEPSREDLLRDLYNKEHR